jgi:hypothetical protein
MTRKLKVIGLALMAVCAFAAVSAGAAQAAPQWKIEGTTLPVGTTQEVEISAVTTPFTLEVVGLGINLKCTNIDGKGTINNVTTSGVTTGEDAIPAGVVFTGCEVENAPAKCQVDSTSSTGVTGAIGTITTEPVTTKLKTVAGEVYDVFSPPASGVFARIMISAKEGQSCAVSGNYEVKGTAAQTLGSEAIELSSTFSAATATAAGTALTFGGKAATLTGVADFKLIKTNVGKKWGATP